MPTTAETTGRPPAYTELADVADIFERVCEDMDAHMLKEEHVLFPMARALAAPPAG